MVCEEGRGAMRGRKIWFVRRVEEPCEVERYGL